MTLEDLINKDLVKFDSKVNSKEQLIDEMVEMLYKNDKISDQDGFRKVVLEREAQFSTGIGMGLAVPHGKSNFVKSAAIAFCKINKGIDFGAIDNDLVRFVFMIAVPNAEATVHLKVLSEISRKIMHEKVRIKLAECKDFEEFISIMR